MSGERLPYGGATNQASSLTIVLSAIDGAHVFTDDEAAGKFLLANQPVIRSVVQVPLNARPNGRRLN